MDSYYKSPEFRDILTRYEHMRDQAGDDFIDAADYADVAEYYLAQSDEARAREAAQRGVDIFPDALPPLAVLARIEMNHGRCGKARELIAGAKDKDELEYHYVMAELMIAEGDADRADDYLASLQSDDDPDELALDACAIFIDHNQFAKARKWLDKVEDRTKPDAQDFEAHILTGQGRLDEGERKVNELLDEDPFSTEQWNHLASVQYMRGDYHASIDSSDFALALDADNAEALLNKANSFYALRNYTEALTFYDRFTALRPDNLSAEFYRGLTLALLKRHDAAIAVFDSVFRQMIEGIREGDLQSREIIADLIPELCFELSEKQEYDRAQEYADQALAAIRGDETLSETRSFLYLCKAKLCFLQNDSQGVLTYYQQAQKAYDTPETFVRMTSVLYECGYVERAYDILASRLLADEGRTWTTGHAYLARYAYELGKTDEFEKLVATAAQRNPLEASHVLYDLYPVGTQPQDYPTTPPLPLGQGK